jgi:mRNA-degrading endonuclease RelE of RelBE toxin-antitoxin system
VPWEIERDEAFDKALKSFCKKLPNAGDDVLDAFKDGPPISTDPLPGFQKKLWKGRVKSSDLKKGKSGGLRVIYYWDEALPNWCCIGTVYPKGERENLTAQELDRLFVSFKTKLDRFKIFVAEMEAKKKADTKSDT